MLNLVVLSLAIVASKAALSCNGASYMWSGKEKFAAVGICTGGEHHEYALKSSNQNVCKDGKIYTATYTSSTDCTGDYTVSEFCVPNFKNCTSVICDQGPCEYIKVASYSGVISCDPYVVDKTTGIESIDAIISGVCTIHSGSYLWECDESGQPINKLYRDTDDCTGSSTVFTVDDLSTTCDLAIKYGFASTYSCGTATNDETIQIPETPIIASKAALSCNGASYTYNGKERFEAAGVCTGGELISPEYAAIYSYQHVCKDGKIYRVTYASSSDCTGDSTVADFCSPNYKDCTSICDQDPCEYIKVTSYSGVISCDPYVVNKTNGGETTSAYISGVCDIYHSGSYLWVCDESGQPIHTTYTTDDCIGTGEPLTIDELTGEPSIRCDSAIKYGNAITYSCATATNDETIQIPGTITAVSGAVSSCGIFVVMIFVIGMLSWM